VDKKVKQQVKEAVLSVLNDEALEAEPPDRQADLIVQRIEALFDALPRRRGPRMVPIDLSKGF
jgi:hypothetical protein